MVAKLGVKAGGLHGDMDQQVRKVGGQLPGNFLWEEGQSPVSFLWDGGVIGVTRKKKRTEFHWVQTSYQAEEQGFERAKFCDPCPSLLLLLPVIAGSHCCFGRV